MTATCVHVVIARTLTVLLLLVCGAIIISPSGCGAHVDAGHAEAHGAPTRPAEDTRKRFEYATLSMGGRARVVFYAIEDRAEAVRRAFAVLEDVEQALSDYRPGSEARRLVEQPVGKWTEVSAMLYQALERARRVHDASDGAFDVSIGPVTALWREATAARRSPAPDALERARAAVGMDKIEFATDVAADVDQYRARVLVPGMRLDFGAIGKGLGADLALASLRRDGLDSAMVELGGDLVVGAPPPGEPGWLVGVSDGERTVHRVLLVHQGAATSGDAYRFTLVEGVRASHVIEPGTAMPAPGHEDGRGTVTVIADEGWIADAVATIARLRGLEAADRAGSRLGGVRLVPLANAGGE